MVSRTARREYGPVMEMWVISVLFFLTTLCEAENSCPEVKIVGVGESDKLTILRGCPGTPGFHGQKGELGAPGEKGDRGLSGAPGKQGPPGQKGEIGSSGMKGEPGVQGMQGQKGEKADPSSSVYEARNCKELLEAGFTMSGWYTMILEGKKPLKVLCDMHTDGGGWIVFQRRMDGSVGFSRDWISYKNGFGSYLTEFWLGNDNIHQITSSGSERWELRVDFQDFDYVRYFAKYSSFKVHGESEKYKLELGSYTSGNAGDSMTYQNGMKFSTLDKDNDLDSRHCAQTFKGGWWYNQCHYSNLNGHYFHGQHASYADGINWREGKGYNYSYKQTEMKIRSL